MRILWIMGGFSGLVVVAFCQLCVFIICADFGREVGMVLYLYFIDQIIEEGIFYCVLVVNFQVGCGVCGVTCVMICDFLGVDEQVYHVVIVRVGEVNLLVGWKGGWGVED